MSRIPCQATMVEGVETNSDECRPEFAAGPSAPQLFCLEIVDEIVQDNELS